MFPRAVHRALKALAHRNRRSLNRKILNRLEESLARRPRDTGELLERIRLRKRAIGPISADPGVVRRRSPLIVVDAAVVVELLPDVEIRSDAEALCESDPEWVAPRLLVSALEYVLVGLVRKDLLDMVAAAEVLSVAVGDYEGRQIEVTGTAVLTAALDAGLSAYDAEYVVEARTLGVRLATRDRVILRAAPDVAIAPAAS